MTDAPTVLIVDDNEDLLDTFSLILKRCGFYVETAKDGFSAIDKFKEHNFDVTLMDVIMPKMNGVEAFRKIRAMNPEAVVILMTAYSEEELIQIAKDEGARHVIRKPIRIDQLIGLIKEAASSQPILIVDDDTDVCQTLTSALELQGYQALATGSGEEAILIAQEKECQIAFVDIKMPNMDGLETFLRLKEINPDILTVMMTGFRNEVKNALDEAQLASAITCLYKPFASSEVTELVRKIGKKPRNSGRKYEG